MDRRIRKLEGIPVLKLPPRYLPGAVAALHQNAFDRDGFRDAIMQLFPPGRGEKSVFRGMVVPTLRALGLLIGFEREIALSSNGVVVYLGLERRPEDKGPLAVVLAELERARGLDEVWPVGPLSSKRAQELLEQAEREMPGKVGDVGMRVRSWIAHLEFAGVVVRTRDGQLIRVGLRPRAIASSKFRDALVDSYRRLTPRVVGEALVTIEDLRCMLAEIAYRETGAVVTQERFDRMLAHLVNNRRLDIRLHRAMGADQGLFIRQGIPYRSLSLGDVHG